MGKKASLSVVQRAQIVAFSKMKLSERQIGNKLKVARPLSITPSKNSKMKKLLQIRKEQDVPRFLAPEISA